MTQIEVTFLGTTAGVPTKYRNHAALHVKYRSQEEFSCLFDCGEGTQRQLLLAGINFMDIDHIFISHWHADHFAGLLGLLETMNLEGRREPLRIYGPEASKFVPLIESLGYSTKDFGLIPVDAPFEGSDVAALLESEEFTVQTIPMKHGIPAVAYALVEKDRVNIDKELAKAVGLPEKGPIFGRLKRDGEAPFKGRKITLKDIAKIIPGKKIVYTGDTMPNRNIAKISKNADLLVHDSTFFEDVEDMTGYKHTRADDALRIAKEANVKQTVLTHISRRYQSLKELEDYAKSKGATIATDMLKIIV